MNTIAEMRDRCEAWLSQLELAVPTLADSAKAEFRRSLDEAFADPRVRVLVCGEWSVGKSALINALIGTRELLPVDVNPCSSYITLIEQGPAPSFHCQTSGIERQISRDAFLALTAKNEFDPTVDHLRVVGPQSWPTGDAVVIDTPGLEDVTAQRSDVTLKYLPRADAIVVIVDAIGGVRGSVRKFVEQHLLQREQRRLVLVMTKKDHLNSEEDVQRRLANCKESLADLAPHAPWLAAESHSFARNSADGMQSSGIAELRAEIDRLVRRERGAVLAARFAGGTAAHLSNLQARLAAEEASLRLPLREAEERVADFRRRAREAREQNNAAFRAAKAAVKSEIAPWIAGLPQEVRRLTDDARERIAALDGLDALRNYVNTDELGRRLGQEVRALSEELSHRLRVAIEKVSATILQDQVVEVDVVQLDISGAMPEVDSVFRHVPSLVVKVLEVLIADVFLPGGPVTALFSRLGLDAFLSKIKGLSLLRSVMPEQLMRNQLSSEVERSLLAFEQNIGPSLLQAAAEATEGALDSIRAALDERVAQVEQGLVDAQSLLRERELDAGARRAEIALQRVALEQAQLRLDDLRAEFT